MINLLLATKNQSKKKEIKQILDQKSAQIKLFDLTDFRIISDFKEGESSFMENAVGKSVYYSKLKHDILVVAEDSGLEVNALDNGPGVMSARYYGPGASDEQNIVKLLSDLSEIEERTARFVCTLALSFGGTLIKTFFGVVAGEITLGKRGSQGFGYDPVFYHTAKKKTFAELSPEVKNLISHRFMALEKMLDYLLQNPINMKQ